MVNMQDGKTDAGVMAQGEHEVEKRYGVGAAGDGEAEMRNAVEQAVMPDVICDGGGDGLRVGAVTAGLWGTFHRVYDTKKDGGNARLFLDTCDRAWSHTEGRTREIGLVAGRGEWDDGAVVQRL